MAIIDIKPKNVIGTLDINWKKVIGQIVKDADETKLKKIKEILEDRLNNVDKHKK